MNNSITYYKMKSPYEGDITKNCALTGPEVDNNFFTLEGRDVESISVDGSDIVLNLLNGKSLKAEDALDNFIINVSYDSENGVLTLYRNNGDTEEISGFKPEPPVHKPCDGDHCHHHHMMPSLISTDETIDGDGTHKNPLGLNNSYKTGFYKPVNAILDGDIRCNCNENLVGGDRFLTCEKISQYGLLYDYKAVCQIVCELDKTHSKWRVPTKEDWDDMLNAVEAVECDRNHNAATPNKYLGKWAGKILKSRNLWKKVDKDCDCGEETVCNCGKNHPCKPTYCGEYGTCVHKPTPCDCDGFDKYGFNIVPAGYADDGNNLVYFGERASFWTATNINRRNVFVKRFEYNRCNVHQDLIAAENHLSLRLIKDYNGKNYKPVEDILGQSYPTVLMPSKKDGKAIWTSVNIYFNNKDLKSLNPNEDESTIFVKKYFIDEWDGHRWTRNELKEGEKVVVKTTADGRENVEYMLTNGELVDTASSVYQEVLNSVSEDINKLDEKINDEIARSTEKDNELNEKIENVTADLATEKEEREQDVNTLNEKIDNESVIREQEDSKLQTQIDIKVDWVDVSDEQNADRKAIVLKNHDILLGSNTNGSTFNLAMVSKWDVADFGSSQLHLNLNSNDRPSVNDKEEIAYISDVNSLSESSKEAIDELNNKLIEEATERENKDTELSEKITENEGKLLTSEGTEFDKESGVLTLKSDKGTNDVKIQFGFNFGSF